MRKNIKAPVDALTLTEARNRDAEQVNFNTVDLSRQVVDYIFVGREHAHTARELSEWLSVKEREITKAIERARLHGAPICANCNGDRPGYYLAANADELHEYLQSFKRRRRNIVRTEAALMTTFCAMTGQTRMDLPGGDLDAGA